MLGAGFATFGLHVFGSLIVQSSICYSVTKPIILSPTTADPTSTSIVLQGVAPSGSVVQITDNTTIVATVTADSSSEFAVQVDLAQGQNDFTAVDNNECSVATSDTFSVARTVAVSSVAMPPTVAILTPPVAVAHHKVTAYPITVPLTSTLALTPTPTLDLTVNKPTTPSAQATVANTYFVTGQTTVPSTVVIKNNNKVVATIAQATLAFGVNIPLDQGNNTIEISSMAAGGQQSTESFQITSLYDFIEWYNTATGHVTLGAGIVVLLGLVVFLLLV